MWYFTGTYTSHVYVCVKHYRMGYKSEDNEHWCKPTYKQTKYFVKEWVIVNKWSVIFPSAFSMLIQYHTKQDFEQWIAANHDLNNIKADFDNCVMCTYWKRLTNVAFVRMSLCEPHLENNINKFIDVYFHITVKASPVLNHRHVKIS